jgi:hypothetical protein
MSLTAGLLFAYRKSKLRINGVKNNSYKSLGIAIIGIGIVLALSVFVGTTFFKWSGASVTDFLVYSKGAVLGAEVSPLAGNPLLEFFIFVLAFPIVETVLIIQLFDLIISQFNITLDIKNWKVWFVAMLMGIGAIFYHIFAKSVAVGKANENVLMVIFFIFFVECLIATITKEFESSIYHHMINNVMAIGIMPLFSYLLQNPLIAIILILAILGVTGAFKKLSNQYAFLRG